MHSIKFTGTHYDIGYKWGNTLKINGINLLNNIPFPITQERIDFGNKSIAIYEEYFPEILEEIRGIGEGQDCSIETLTGVLFPMYCIMPAQNCSCFVAKSNDGIILGRNSDFLTHIEHLYMNTEYKFLNNSYGFIGNTTAFVEMEDGINQHRLAIGLTSVAPTLIQPGINAGFMLRMFLEKCKTVNDVVDLLNNIPIGSSQTFVVADKLGTGALIECNPQNIEIKYIGENDFLYSTNMFNISEMKKYNNLPEDNWFAQERYNTMDSFFNKQKNTITTEQAKNLLSGGEGFICQYDRKTGKDTVWSVIYDLAKSEVFLCKGNPIRNKFKEI